MDSEGYIPDPDSTFKIVPDVSPALDPKTWPIKKLACIMGLQQGFLTGVCINNESDRCQIPYGINIA
jgi:hypothetical protein